MKILITGASGFVGTGVLAEALASPAVDEVVSLCRKPSGHAHPKLTELAVRDFLDLSEVADQLVGFDACFWCLGTSSGGMDEAAYTKITLDFTLHAARLLADTHSKLAFCFLSGSGADGSAMWARVKKRTEVELGDLGFDSLTIFRPAYIRGDHGAQLRGTLYRIVYAITTPLSPLFRRLGGATSNTEIGRAMLLATQGTLDGEILDSKTINQRAAEWTSRKT